MLVKVAETKVNKYIHTTTPYTMPLQQVNAAVYSSSGWLASTSCV